MNWKKLQGNIYDAGMATAGGAAGRVITNKVIPMIPFIKDHKKFHPLATFLIGAALADNSKLHYAGIGMAAVAGVDQAAEFVPMLKPAGGSITGIDDLGKQLADELEARLNADVNDPGAAMNADVNAPGANMNNQLSEDGMLGIEAMDERLEGIEEIEGIEEEL